jgi:4-hydroxy-2-oxoheptanedioate aldolase
MPHKALADAWAADRAALGCWITTESDWAVEALGQSGFDYVLIDCQHSLIAEAVAGRMLTALAATPAAGVVRVSKNDPALIGRVLDAGADGVVVPMVNSAEEAAAAVAACRYAPGGVRSFGPFRAGLGFDIAALQERVSCFVMIETAKAVANAAEICAVPGLAGVFVGPADLAIDMGIPVMSIFGGTRPAAWVEAIATARKSALAAGIVAGIPAFSPADAVRYAGEGFRFITIGADRGFIRERASQVVKDFRKSTCSGS